MYVRVIYEKLRMGYIDGKEFVKVCLLYFRLPQGLRSQSVLQ